MLDGEHMAERCVVVALAITADGTKMPVGLWDGSTENKTVVRSLLADLVERGLAFDDGLLVVLDGAKALSAAVREVFGAKALIQRCTLHKRRNLADHLPDKEQAWVDAKLVKAFGHPDPDTGLRNAKSLAAQLDKNYPSAAASLREGLEEMFTVARLGIDGRLAKTLTTSNPVESMISIARATNRNVPPSRSDGEGFKPVGIDAADEGRSMISATGSMGNCAATVPFNPCDHRTTFPSPSQGLQADAPTARSRPTLHQHIAPTIQKACAPQDPTGVTVILRARMARRHGNLMEIVGHVVAQLPLMLDFQRR